MGDELEPFKKLIELGCEDFVMLLDEVCVVLPSASDPKKIQICNLPFDGNPRINRFAAARCSECWSMRFTGTEKLSLDARTPQPLRTQKIREREEAWMMITQARAFGEKYGASS